MLPAAPGFEPHGFMTSCLGLFWHRANQSFLRFLMHLSEIDHFSSKFRALMEFELNLVDSQESPEPTKC